MNKGVNKQGLATLGVVVVFLFYCFRRSELTRGQEIAKKPGKPEKHVPAIIREDYADRPYDGESAYIIIDENGFVMRIQSNTDSEVSDPNQ